MRNSGSGIFLENEKISVASVFEAATFVARTEQPREEKRGRRQGKRSRGSSGFGLIENESEEKKIKKMAEKFPKIT